MHDGQIRVTVKMKASNPHMMQYMKYVSRKRHRDRTESNAGEHVVEGCSLALDGHMTEIKN